MKLQETEREECLWFDLNHSKLLTTEGHITTIYGGDSSPTELICQDFWVKSSVHKEMMMIFLVIGYIITSTLIDPLSLSLGTYQPYMFFFNFNNAELWK